MRHTHGAAFVSSRMCLPFKSLGSGRVCRCFSRELRRSTGEMGVVSTEDVVSSAMIVRHSGLRVCQLLLSVKDVTSCRLACCKFCRVSCTWRGNSQA